VAGMRTRAGELLERQMGASASQMGGLQQAMGAGTAQMIAGQTDLVSRLQQAAAQGDAAAQTELASMQAQGYSNIGAQLAGVPQASTFVPQSPISGALEGAVVGARLAEMFPEQQQVQAPVFNSQPYVAPTQPAAIYVLQRNKRHLLIFRQALRLHNQESIKWLTTYHC
jgi:hypothetical protein